MAPAEPIIRVLRVESASAGATLGRGSPMVVGTEHRSAQACLVDVPRLDCAGRVINFDAGEMGGGGCLRRSTDPDTGARRR